MAVVVAGQLKDVPGLHTVSWLEEPRLRLRWGEDFRRRGTGWIRQIILHTTKGLPARPNDPPQRILQGLGAPVNAGERCAQYWSHDGRQAGAHLVVDHDGTVACCADLQSEATFHAGSVNDSSIGVEIYQGQHGELYLGQLQAVLLLCDWLTRWSGIQRQIPDRYLGGPLHRLETGGETCVGVFGHRDVTANRGCGDPGSAVFDLLAQAGYEAFDFRTDNDREAWRRRQAKLGVPADGVPGPQTVRFLKLTHSPAGLWVTRPGDGVGP